MPIKINIPIPPKAQQRVRHAVRGKHAMAYKSKSQQAAEDTFNAFLLSQRPPKPLTGALKLTVRAYMPIPKSKPKWWRESARLGRIVPTTKPDLDNLMKFAKDCFTQMNVWADDKQVVEYGEGTGKYYSDEPRWEIEISEVDNAIR